MLTQSHIDKFTELYPNCTELDFDITINGDGGSDITNVSAFALIEKAEDIKIENCHLLKNLNGLNKLKEVDWLTISSNETLESIKALGGLQKATLISINHNPILDWTWIPIIP